MVRRLDPQQGDTVLELAAGLADTGLMAARLVGESGHVIVTGFTPEMVAAARRRAEELGGQNAEFRVLDAERMDLATDSVGGVLCRWAYMLMIDPLRLSRKLGACCDRGAASILGLGRPRTQLGFLARGRGTGVTRAYSATRP